MYKGREKKISTSLSAFSALLCTVAFLVAQKFMQIFININRYNIVYGVFSRLIVMLLGIYVFFMLFLYFAEFMFVVQFFDELLLGELYLLQGGNMTTMAAKIRYAIFVQPDYFFTAMPAAKVFSDGEIIYRADEIAENTYYIAQGSVKIEHGGEESVLKRGCFFGEMSAVVGKTRDNTARSFGSATVVVISKDQFINLMHRNKEVARKVFEQISVYFSRIY